MPLVTLQDVSLRFRGPRVLDGVQLQIDRGERLCLLGRNGEGKSTLLRLIQGELEPDEGQVVRQQGLVTAMLIQEVPRDLAGTVFDAVSAGRRPGHRLLGDYRVETVLSRMGLQPDAQLAAALGRHETSGALGPGPGRRAGRALAGRADQPPRPGRHHLAGRVPPPLCGHAADGDPRPRFPPQAGHADHRARPRPADELVLRLRHVPGPQASGPGGRGRPAGTVRQAAGPGRGLDPPQDRGPADPQSGPRPLVVGHAGDPPPAPRPAGSRQGAAPGGRAIGPAGDRSQGRLASLRRAHDPRGLLHAGDARRPRGDHRSQRLGQDHALADPAGRAGAHRGRRPPRDEPRAGLLRPAPRAVGRREDASKRTSPAAATRW